MKAIHRLAVVPAAVAAGGLQVGGGLRVFFPPKQPTPPEPRRP